MRAQKTILTILLVLAILPYAALSVRAGDGLANIVDLGADPSGIGDSSAAFMEAVAQLGGVGTIYMAKGTYKLSEDLTIPQGIDLQFARGAMIAVDAGKALAIGGTIDAGIFQIFSGAGTITGTPLNEYGFPQWFGAKGDGVTDDTVAFDKAIKLMAGKTVRLPQRSTGYYLSDLTIDNAVRIQGDAAKTKLVPNPGVTNLITINSSNVSITGIFVDMNTAGPGSSVFVLCAAGSSVIDYRSGLELSEIYVQRAYCVVKDAGVGGIINSELNDVVAYLCKDTPYVFQRMLGYNTFRNVTADFVGVEIDYPGFVMENTSLGSTVFDALDMLGGVLAGGNTTGGHGFVFTNCKNLILRRSMVDTNPGDGIQLISCSDIILDDVAVSLQFGHGIVIEDCYNITAGLLRVRGRSDITPYNPMPIPDMDGLKITGSHDVNIDNVMSIANTGRGIVLDNSSNIMITNAMTWYCKDYGYYENGSGNFIANLIINQTYGNPIKQMGADSYIRQLSAVNDDSSGEWIWYGGSSWGYEINKTYSGIAGAYEITGP